MSQLLLQQLSPILPPPGLPLLTHHLRAPHHRHPLRPPFASWAVSRSCATTRQTPQTPATSQTRPWRCHRQVTGLNRLQPPKLCTLISRDSMPGFPTLGKHRWLWLVSVVCSMRCDAGWQCIVYRLSAVPVSKCLGNSFHIVREQCKPQHLDVRATTKKSKSAVRAETLHTPPATILLM